MNKFLAAVAVIARLFKTPTTGLINVPTTDNAFSPAVAGGEPSGLRNLLNAVSN